MVVISAAFWLSLTSILIPLLIWINSSCLKFWPNLSLSLATHNWLRLVSLCWCLFPIQSLNGHFPIILVVETFHSSIEWLTMTSETAREASLAVRVSFQAWIYRIKLNRSIFKTTWSIWLVIIQLLLLFSLSTTLDSWSFLSYFLSGIIYYLLLSSRRSLESCSLFGF